VGLEVEDSRPINTYMSTMMYVLISAKPIDRRIVKHKQTTRRDLAANPRPATIIGTHHCAY
ncbi:unnamed protein product, partial [marine sediment metagenome]